MVGDGVKAGGGGDEFAGQFHAQEHFAASFVVVAGGGEDRFDGLRIGTCAQKLEDGLTLGRTNGTGGEPTEGDGIGCRQPLYGRDILWGGSDGVGKGSRGGTRGVFGGEQQAVALVGGIGDKQEVTASGDEHRGSGTARLEKVGGDTCEGAGEDDGAVGASSQVDEVG